MITKKNIPLMEKSIKMIENGFPELKKTKYLTTKEAGKRVHRTTQTIRLWLRNGKIFIEEDYIRVCDGYLIKEEAVKRILSEI